MLSRTHLPPSGFIEPCLPSSADRPPTGPDWIHEIKHDGYRLMARRDPVGIRLLTRNGHDCASRYPLIVEAVNRLRARSCLIDGEAVACDENGLAVFERLRLKPSETMSSSTPSISWSSTAKTFGASRWRRARRRSQACCAVPTGCRRALAAARRSQLLRRDRRTAFARVNPRKATVQCSPNTSRTSIQIFLSGWFAGTRALGEMYENSRP
jgi:hypothetical protein